MASDELIDNGVAPSGVPRQLRHSDALITWQKMARKEADYLLAPT
jgi:hypothetical protein